MHLPFSQILHRDRQLMISPFLFFLAVLDTLEKYRNPKDGKLEFKLYWPDAANTWRQSSNPTKPGPVIGYESVKTPFTGESWGGLEYNTVCKPDFITKRWMVSSEKDVLFYCVEYHQ